MADSFEVRPIYLTAAEAEAGVDRTARLADGRQVTVRVPAGVGNGTLLRLPDGDDKVFLKVTFVEPPRKARWPIVPVAVVVGLVAVFIAVDSSNDSDDTASTPTTTTTTTTTYYPTTYTTAYAPTTTEAPVATVEAAPQDGTDVGECLRNRGTATNPSMLPAPCGPNSYEVVAIREGTTDPAFCEAKATTTHTYVVQKFTVYTSNGIEVSRTPNIPESYVFCLSQN